MNSSTNNKKAELLDGFMKHTSDGSLQENYKVLRGKYNSIPPVVLEYPIPHSPSYQLWRHLNEAHGLKLHLVELQEIIHLAKLIPSDEKITETEKA